MHLNSSLWVLVTHTWSDTHLYQEVKLSDIISMQQAYCRYDHGQSFLSLELFHWSNLHSIHAKSVNQQTNLLHLETHAQRHTVSCHNNHAWHTSITLDAIQITSEMIFTADLFLTDAKHKLNTTTTQTTKQPNYWHIHKLNPMILKPRLEAFYAIQLGNGSNVFCSSRDIQSAPKN